jgi:hypothetical protein
MLRTMMTSRIHRATVTRVDADDRVAGPGSDPAETYGAELLTRGDIILG